MKHIAILYPEEQCGLNTVACIVGTVEVFKRLPPRYNMPFEFGIFFGCKYYGEAKQGKKRFLIFEEKRFDLKK